jgi:Fur family ferric uptake transcriptional regulator
MDQHDALRKYMAARGLKATRQREAIIREFFKSAGHVSVEELHHRVQKKQPRVGYATVYRTLRLLLACGLAHEGKFGNGGKLYEPRQGQGHHDHLICVQCGQIVEFTAETIESLQKEVAHKKGFTLLHHKLELYGHCRKCAEENSRRGEGRSRA